MKKIARTWALCAIALAAAVAAQGCVSNGTYNELDARHKALQENNEALLAELAERNAELEEAKRAAAVDPAPISPELAPPNGNASVESGSADGAIVSANGENRYTLKQGETLWTLAVRTYGDGQKWRIIRDANPGLVTEEGKAKQGVTLVIPAP